MAINWIFFDVGSTLVDETEAYDHRARDMIEGTNLTFSEFNQVRHDFARMGLDGNSEAIRHFGLKKTPWHSEDEKLFPDAHDVLTDLYKKGYRLGIIANQNSGLEKRLEAWGIRKFFRVIVSSAEAGCVKPDRAIFELALKTAGCEAEESVMVGDRLDNDMMPAKEIGMKTVWIRTGLLKVQPLKLGKGICDIQIESLTELTEIFE